MSDNYDKLKAQYDALRERENRDLIENSQTVKDLRFGLKELTAEWNKAKAILKALVAMDDLMNDPDYSESGTYAGAYYAYYKGHASIWDDARKAIQEDSK